MKVKKTKSDHFRKIKQVKAKKLGGEFGAIIENKPENYPPIGDWKNSVFLVNEKCVGCTQCEKHCPEGAISMKQIGEKKVAVIDPEFCKGCGICKGVCPLGAVEVVESKN